MVGGVATVVRLRDHAGQLQFIIAMLVPGAAVGGSGCLRATTRPLSTLPSTSELVKQFAGQRNEQLGVAVRQRR